MINSVDQQFNMNGTFNGLSDFNLGQDPAISLKAAYTTDSLYILVTWKDSRFNAARANWFFNGPADPKKPGTTTGWTSQQTDDKFMLFFDMGSGKKDVWNWSLALSEPLGYAIDMIDDGSGAVEDAGNKLYVRNAAGDGTTGPKYIWDGVQQEIIRKPGGFTILDPGYYLLNKKEFTGDPAAGDVVFQADCAGCHGSTGDGNGPINPVGIQLNRPGQFSRFTRTALDNFATNAGQHEGAIHYPAAEVTRRDLYARLLGFGGVPGYYLENPTGENPDVHAVSNVIMGKIDGANTKGYSVLFVRALNTGKADDIAFLPATKSVFDFNIRLMDNDDLNSIGAVNKQITFKPKP